MKVFLSIVKWIWWLGLAYLPLKLWSLERSYMDRIGCPPRGDCYAPGSEILLDWDLLIMGAALLVWPVCLWFLVVVPLRAFWIRLRPNNSFKPKPLRGSA
ncbi:hypothetical protein J2X06_001247 [Lysobacter niastensis]|uniref:Uncharacterized protein n=1 Tax=Lysobacter niastensis TaxID=380629 RepID=A0ABU1W5H6_9GAMM|nr:hypothetical protein [Lysobacter niastensis]MDR7132837.1 hypothetical protein [Lysobacter niastensis]MDR7134056.1 hypothetical protein [Lysobacter niastensis]MDR7134063.1 hypothetical protein [Lysobacter niastensis]